MAEQQQVNNARSERKEVRYVESPLGFYSRNDVLDLTTWSPMTLWRMIQKEQFPPSVQLSANRVGWSRAKVDAWMREKEGGYEAYEA